MKVAELRVLLRANGLKVSGKKQELIERLREHRENEKQDSSTTKETDQPGDRKEKSSNEENIGQSNTPIFDASGSVDSNKPTAKRTPFGMIAVQSAENSKNKYFSETRPSAAGEKKAPLMSASNENTPKVLTHTAKKKRKKRSMANAFNDALAALSDLDNMEREMMA